MNSLKTALQYAEDVRSGKVVVSRYVKLAVDRFYHDLETAKSRGYYFSETAASKALHFFDFLVLTKGITPDDVPKEQVNPDGSIKFALAPWQAFIIANLFGWKKISDNKRRFTEAYVAIPKKNGKTTKASGIANLMLFADNEPGPEVYLAAYTRDQANICFDESVTQIKGSPALKKRANLLKHSVTTSVRGKMMAVSHDADNTEGKNSHCVILDEYHVHKSDKVKNSLQSGMAARKQPLLFIITTAGFNKQGPCYKYQEMCINMLEGRIELDNVFAIIYGIDEGDDWKDEKTWVKANPNLGISVQMDYLRREFKKALQSGSKEVDFKTKHLNLWVDAEVTWIQAEIWKGMSSPEFDPPSDAVCYAGLDLGRSNDMAAFSLFFPEYNYITTRYYVAEDAAQYAARAGIDYLDWINDGHLIATPGKTTDYDYILRDIIESAEKYDLRFLGYDPYSSQYFRDKLSDELGTTYAGKIQEDGFVKFGEHKKVQPFRQGFISMGPPTRSFEERCLNLQLKHDGNPITGWMLSNVVLDQDAAGNIKPAKDKSKDKIDGVVAMVMAIGMYEIWGNYQQENIDISSLIA